MDIEKVNAISSLIIRYKKEINDLREIENNVEVDLKYFASYGDVSLAKLDTNEFISIKSSLISNRLTRIESLTEQLSEQLKND